MVTLPVSIKPPANLYVRWKNSTPEERSKWWASMEPEERKGILAGVYRDYRASKDLKERQETPPANGAAASTAETPKIEKLRRMFDGLTQEQQAAVETELSRSDADD